MYQYDCAICFDTVKLDNPNWPKVICEECHPDFYRRLAWLDAFIEDEKEFARQERKAKKLQKDVRALPGQKRCRIKNCLNVPYSVVYCRKHQKQLFKTR